MRRFIWRCCAVHFKFSIFKVRVSAGQICKFGFKFEREKSRRSIFVLDEAFLNLATGVTI